MSMAFTGGSDNALSLEHHSLYGLLGTGATLYVLQAGSQGLNVSVSVDDGPDTFNTLAPPQGPDFYQSNVSLFDVQSLSFGQHSLVLTVYDYGLGSSNMMFDYATINNNLAVNTTVTTLTSSSSSTSTLEVPTSSAASESSSTSVLAASASAPVVSEPANAASGVSTG